MRWRVVVRSVIRFLKGGWQRRLCASAFGIDEMSHDLREVDALTTLAQL